ncbi:MAG: nitric-oxide reductase large subunit [Methylophilus methylotrophus]|jgi:nitric oxide reductase subunit B|uniref:Nitric-oxide reductase large subunit n=1 Tax=Methylophilus methylotrophus TaxID=17 RepID=A0A5C7WJT0_METME|nr:nitric-oxide reductase large subunit [Methylophilus sp.]PPD12772.1 MAG: nitric oxide reductase large subunit [Methylophilus sp.]TXI37182.1 MAG: nitric-oxide reductase large subunit [Methylophilus methylotrophus]
MGIYKKLWLILIAVLIVTFTILGYMGTEVYHSVPPIPQNVMSNDHQLEFKEADILAGQSHWQSIGGMQVGSIWGHGAYQAPDWTADWLHRELIAWLNLAAQETYSSSYDMLDPVKQAGLREMLKQEYRSNRLDDQGVLSLTPRRAKAVQQTAAYYGALFSDAPELKKTRIAYAMKDNTLPDAKARQKMAYFFFWTSWAAATERAEGAVTYTNNWPHEPLIANKPSSENILWSMGSIVFLLAGIGLLILGWTALRKEDDVPPKAGKLDPITSFALTPSQQALGKYLFIVVALLIFQVFIGGFTAHYTVEGQEFYGVDVSQWFPYSLTRTWHIQSALFWIATGFLAAGLFLAPIINGGKDPAYQKLGVNILFIALLIVVTGSFLGQYSAIAHLIPTAFNFWFGHQGYEYIDLGRFWQIALFVGLLLWLGLMLRCMIPALKAKDSDKNLLALLTASVIAIGLFYGSGLFYGEHSNLSVMEYWRWWVVHLWVEGIFEVFATAALAYIFMSLGLVSRSVATTTSLASASLFMVGGIPGTFHHLYFSGTTTPVMAIGASFSALEVVPLLVLGHEAWHHWHLHKRAIWLENLRWPLCCFAAVAFWNMLGAGVFGFLINPPISLYYIQGLNTTAVHAHAALFGVYGFLAIGFCLLVLRYIRPHVIFNEKLMRTGFWALNIGLLLMIFTSLLPIGFMQFQASFNEGLWYARSEEFMQQPLLQTLRWVRTFGDVVFIIGALSIASQVTLSLLDRKPYHHISTV